MNHPNGAFRMMAIAAAAAAAMMGAPTSKGASISDFAHFHSVAGRRRRGRGRSWYGKNERARLDGIPKAFRQYCRRYHGSIA